MSFLGQNKIGEKKWQQPQPQITKCFSKKFNPQRRHWGTRYGRTGLFRCVRWNGYTVTVDTKHKLLAVATEETRQVDICQLLIGSIWFVHVSLGIIEVNFSYQSQDTSCYSYTTFHSIVYTVNPNVTNYMYIVPVNNDNDG